MKFVLLFILTSCYIVSEISGHGMLWDPPNRSSLWRFDPSAPANYEDDENFCGGIGVQWDQNDGKCGLCGDAYNSPHPQPNENTGVFGRGKVVKTYQSGSLLEVKSNLTANHFGRISYSLCVLTNPDAPESGEDCFIPLKFSDGSLEYKVPGSTFRFTHHIQLPNGLKCDRCVLRWQYIAGNNWGKCDDGSYATGCGPQEWYRSCADITIA